jgi:tetratricopeptide (TPR) repeat protein
MDLEQADFSYAWAWSLEAGLFDHVAGAVDGLCGYYRLCGRFEEGLSASRQALQSLRDHHILEQNLPLWARLETWQAVFLNLQDEQDQALQVIEPVVQALENIAEEDAWIDQTLAFSRLVMAEVIFPGDYVRALKLAEKSLAQLRLLDDPWYTSQSLFVLFSFHDAVGNRIESQNLALEAWEIQHTLGDPSLIALIQTVLSYNYTLAGEVKKALEIVQAQTALPEAQRDRINLAAARAASGLALAHAGRFEESRSNFLETIADFEFLNNPDMLYYTRGFLCWVDLSTGRYADAQATSDWLIQGRPSNYLAWLLRGSGQIVKAEDDQAELSLRNSQGDPSSNAPIK